MFKRLICVCLNGRYVYVYTVGMCMFKRFICVCLKKKTSTYFMILSGGRTTVVYGASRLSLDNLHILQENGKCHNLTGNLECMFVDQY